MRKRTDEPVHVVLSGDLTGHVEYVGNLGTSFAKEKVFRNILVCVDRQ